MRIALYVSLAILAAFAIYLFLDLSRVSIWAVDAQRGFQNQMASGVRALKAGEASAYVTLLSATAAYGFVHALGPGHGKYLVGGVGLGTSISSARLMGLAVASSVAQALWAIALVYGGFLLIETTAYQMTAFAEDFLAPASYLAIAAIGVINIWRGTRTLGKTAHHAHDDRHHLAYADHDCCGRSHGPTAQEAASVKSFRDAFVLVLSIAIRPCTGAIFLLVITWQMDILLAGALAVLVMGLGTAMLTSIVAVSSVTVRKFVLVSSDSISKVQFVLPTLQVFTGTLILLISFVFLTNVLN